MSRIKLAQETLLKLHSFTTTSVRETLDITYDFAASLSIPTPSCTISILGRVGHGKTTVSQGLCDYFTDNATPTMEAQLMARNTHAWSLWSVPSKGFMLRRMDEAALDHFRDPVPPCLHGSQIDLVEHARQNTQEQSIALISIAKTEGAENTRLIDFYLNKARMKQPSQKKRVITL